jgi:mannose-6-phosphate isomerase-like protein (cupin superfamily)
MGAAPTEAVLSETEVELAPTGERFRFRSDPADITRLAFDFHVAPGGGVPDRHQHARQSETFRCLHGTLDVDVHGETRQLHPGDELTLPAGTVHSLRNAGDAEVHCEVEYRPAGRNREWFLLVAANTRRLGREPGLLDLAPFIADVDIYLPGPVGPQRALVRWALRPLGILLGRRRRMLACASEAYGRPFRW